jgi:hypothetical protein
MYSAGSAQIVPTPVNAFPATIAAGVTYLTGVIAGLGYGGLAAAAKLDKTGVLVLQRYIDPAGTIAIGDPISQAMTANVQATVAVRDGLPFSAFIVTIQNTSGDLGTLSGTALLMSG